jgi:FG-GAP-like repeat
MPMYLRCAMLTLSSCILLKTAVAEPHWKKHILQDGEGCLTAVAADYTGDEKTDVIASCAKATYLFVAPDWQPVTIGPGERFIHSETFDVDGDGDADYIGATYSPGKVVWYECPAEPTKGSWKERLIDDEINGIHGLLRGDINGDGKFDLIANSAQPKGKFPNSAVWLKVPPQPREAKTWERYVFAQGDAPGLSHYFGVGDVNGDGRPDISLAAKGGEQDITKQGEWFAWWAAPVDPKQAGWKKEIIATQQPGATNIMPGDVNGDQRVDFIATRGHDKGIYWFEAPNWKQHTINAELIDPHSLQVLDFDGDGDLDAASCAYTSKIVAWFENDGRGQFTTHVVAHDQSAYDIRAVDLDGDSDFDLLIGGQQSNNTVWFENPRK